MKETFISQNPYNKDILAEYPATPLNHLDIYLNQSDIFFNNWKNLNVTKRADLFLNLSKIILKEKNDLAALITNEMGKLLKESEAEIQKCADTCEYYAKNAEELLKNQIIITDARKSYVSFQPIGLVLGVMPWNFPIWQVLRFAIPTMMAGNIVALKHASNVSGCALAIESLFEKAGFPKNSFKTLLIKNTQVEKIISHKNTKAVSLTGSTHAGKSVGGISGKYLKKSVLELGGSDPYIILDDADLNSASDICVRARMNNSGQTCIAAKRFIVTETNYSEFLNLFQKKISKYQPGNPLDPTTTLAPLARFDLRDELHMQVQKAIQNGASLICGGKIPDESGAFYMPTILENITFHNPAFYEEFFGPVALFFKTKSEEESIEIANATTFGLGSAVFSSDIDKAQKIAETQIQAGSCFVNAQVRSDPRLPFGGINESGYGRELSSYALLEFTNIKTIYVGQI